MNPAVDRADLPEVNDDLAPGPWAMTKVDPAAELAAFESAAALLAKLVPASIKATRPQDWVEMGGRVYLQATGVERLAPLWGLVFDEPKVTKYDLNGGEFYFSVVGRVWCRRTGVFYGGAEGGRSSADPFFDTFDEDKPDDFKKWPSDQQADWKAAHRIPPDPMDVRKAAVTNWMTRAASMLTGLRNLTRADLEQAGVTGVASVQYGKGGKGGDTTPAELKAAATALGNDVLAAVGGSKDDAKKLLKEITKGKDFDGFESIDRFRFGWQVENARKKLDAHPVFGKAKAQREPGEE